MDSSDKLMADSVSNGQRAYPLHSAVVVASWVIPYLRSIKGRVAALLLLVTVSAVASVVNIHLMRYFIDHLAATRDFHALWLVFAIYVGSVLFSGLADYGYNIWLARIRQGLSRQLKTDLFKKYQLLSLDFFQAHRSGELAQEMEGQTSSIHMGFSAVCNGAKDFILFVCLFVTALRIEPGITLLAIAVFTVVAFVTRRGLKDVRVIARELQVRAGQVQQHLLQSIEAIRIVRIFRAEETETLGYTKKLDRAQAIAYSIASRTAFVNFGNSIMIMAGSAVSFLACGRSVLEGSMSVGEFVALNSALLAMYAPLYRVVEHYANLSEIHGSGETLFQTLRLNPSVKDAGVSRVSREVREITFEDVSFSYPEATDMALERINMSIRPGQINALLGANGSGKSTILNLLARFYDPTHGRIAFDGADIRNFTLESLRESISMVAQESIILDDSILTNISYSRPSASRTEILTAAAAATASEFIDRLPNKYETKVGPRGGKLSGGQLQKISIARALLHPASIFLFDEFTSAIDRISEEKIMATINELAKTRIVIVVTHDASVLPPNSQIFAVKDRKVVCRTIHQDLGKRASS